MKKILFLFSVITSVIACNSKNHKAEEYVAIYKRDTAYLHLEIFENRYHGKLRIEGPGRRKEFGDVQGKVSGDTLVGDYLYKPYKAKEKKRRAFVLKRENGTLLQGFGLEHVYMGIPYYEPSSVSFDGAKFVFKSVQSQRK